MKRFYSLGIWLGLVSFGLLLGCQKKDVAPAKRPARPVAVAKAVVQEVPLYLDEIGKCAAFETVLIQPQVSGAVTEVHFKDGAEISKGDLLFTIDPRPFEAALAKAKASLDQNRAKAVYDEAQLKRNKELRLTNAVALQALDNAVSNAKVSRAAMAADEAQVRQAELNLEYCTIRSPINGRAGKRRIDLGNIVEANKSELLLIQRQTPIYVDFAVEEGSLPKVRAYKKAGTLKVEAAFADDPSIRREGSFDFLDSGVQSETGTVWMRAILENDDRLFWPGQFVNVRLLLDRVKDSVLVPGEAVQVGKKGTFIFVVKADLTVEQRPIVPGQRQGSQRVILEGIKAGETVVVAGQLALSAGATVKIVDSAIAGSGVGGDAVKESSEQPTAAK